MDFDAESSSTEAAAAAFTTVGEVAVAQNVTDKTAVTNREGQNEEEPAKTSFKSDVSKNVERTIVDIALFILSTNLVIII